MYSKDYIKIKPCYKFMYYNYVKFNTSMYYVKLTNENPLLSNVIIYMFKHSQTLSIFHILWQTPQPK